LLRTLVTGLAVACPPERLTFVLVDFKGGAAFDRCADLPHVVGLVTDLDEQLARRAVRGLDAELRRRERLLRDAGAADIAGYRRAAPATAPLPRLVVVIDEFATLAAEHPHVLDAFVGLAQRGRSLGLHLVLATQRPSGAVSDHIRANTDLRIALRVQDPADSIDVLGVADAAFLPRQHPGRGLIRFGPAEVVPFHAAPVAAPAAARHSAVLLAPFGPMPVDTRLGRAIAAAAAQPAVGSHGPGEPATTAGVVELVGAIADAFRSSGAPTPHRPWPDPLPTRLDLDLSAVAPTDAGELGPLPFALADDVDRQRQVPIGWDRRAGNLLLTGMPGSGTSTALTSMALRLAATTRPDRCHLYVLDLGPSRLTPLAALPHVGAVIGAAETERQRRLVLRLSAELTARQADPARAGQSARIVLLLDGAATFATTWSDPLLPVLEALTRLLTEGPAVGIHMALTADRPSAVPRAWAAATAQRVAFRLADLADLAMLGLSPSAVPPLPPGRAVWVEAGLSGQVAICADPAAEVARLAALHGAAPGGPAPVAVLPRVVDPATLRPSVTEDGAWQLPIGIAELTLAPIALVLHPGDHALIAGPARAGRSTALATLAQVAARLPAPHRPEIRAVAGPRSPLAASDDVDEVVDPAGAAGLARASSGGQPLLLLVDDAELVEDSHGDLRGLVAARRPDIHVVAAGRADALRGAFHHWSRGLRASGLGLLLRPSLDLDGELLGVALPRRTPAPAAPGRGWLVDRGTMAFVQTAMKLHEDI
jgi:S-DNA-T family DNA segregation ATPase FtsK/SpoIIIE